MVGREGPDDAVEMVSHAPIRALVLGPHDGESGPGLLSQVNGRVAGSCGNASAPGDGLLGADAGSSWMRTWKQRASNRRAIATVATWLPRR
jgi:hypothetical protein